MEWREPVPNGVSTVTQMLNARYGSAPSNTTLGALRRRNPQLDRFDWLLLVISIEIDLKVRVPARLIESERKTLAQFAKAIASLPRVNSASHTLEMLTLLSQALMSDATATVASKRPSRNARSKRRTRA